MGEARRRKLAGTVRTEAETKEWYARASAKHQHIGPPSPKSRRTPKPLFSVRPFLKSKGKLKK